MKFDVVVVGSGPNGLAAAITMATAGCQVIVLEAADTAGGGARSEALTLPGFVHDVCSTVYPLALASPFLRGLPLPEHGLEWVHPLAPLAHPLDDGTAVLLERSLSRTAGGLSTDGEAYFRMMRPLVARSRDLAEMVLGPLRIPSRPLPLARFGLMAIQSATGVATSRFQSDQARALFAGLAAHSTLPLDRPMSAAAGLFLAVLGHAVGWPFVKEGSQRLSDALVSILRSRGGQVRTGVGVKSLAALPPHERVMLDVTPRQFLGIAGDSLPSGYKSQLSRYRYGPGVFKLDWALDAPVPWKSDGCRLAGTVHLGGTMEEIAESEAAAWHGRHPVAPFVIFTQPSLFDPTRAPAGKQTAWAYCHVPNGSTDDMTDRIEEQVERFAPGFRQRIRARSVMGPAEMERHDANHVGGDIGGGVLDLGQLFTRPVVRLNPYTTPLPRLYLCSSSTPPGGGVHGMCGYWAALSALR